MIRGVDQFFEHDGHHYLIECEDQGTTRGRLDVRVLERGAVLWSKTISYRHLLPRWGTRMRRQQVLARLVVQTSRTVRAGIVRGRLISGVAEAHSPRRDCD